MRTATNIRVQGIRFIATVWPTRTKFFPTQEHSSLPLLSKNFEWQQSTSFNYKYCQCIYSFAPIANIIEAWMLLCLSTISVIYSKEHVQKIAIELLRTLCCYQMLLKAISQLFATFFECTTWNAFLGPYRIVLYYI